MELSRTYPSKLHMHAFYCNKCAKGINATVVCIYMLCLIHLWGTLGKCIRDPNAINEEAPFCYSSNNQYHNRWKEEGTQIKKEGQRRKKLCEMCCIWLCTSAYVYIHICFVGVITRSGLCKFSQKIPWLSQFYTIYIAKKIHCAKYTSKGKKK